MDWLTFISKVIESLAWPFVALVLGLVFRKKLLDLMPALRKLKAGPLEAEFELATKQVLASATEVTAQSKPPQKEVIGDSAEKGQKDIVTKLLEARNDPTGMILGAWAQLEGELFRLGHQMGEILEPLTSREKDLETVMGLRVLPEETRRLVRELHGLRNKVTLDKVIPTSEAAQDYVVAMERVLGLIHNYRKNLPNYRATQP